MITNLPIIFVKGKPSSLSKMTIQELECFITFLVHCSLGHDTVKDIQEPSWWPSDVPFSSPFIRPSIIPKDWDSRLRKLVKLCYKHHGGDLLLKFCEELSNNPPSALQYVKHCDSTTSLYLKSSHRLLVTFRNENILYDDPSRKKNLISNRKSLLPYRQTTASDSIVETESAYLYLCDTCDKVFNDLEEVRKHESVCSQKETTDLSPDSPEVSQPVTDSDLIKEDDQVSFLKLFGLSESSSDGKTVSPVKSDIKPLLCRNNKRFKKTLTFTGLTRYPFSSPAGIRISKNQMRTTDICIKREHLERYCSTPLESAESQKWFTRNSVKHFPTKYKKPDDYWTRYQVFCHQRNKIMLDIDSQLLFLKCKPLSIVLNRLSEEDINNCKLALKRPLNSDVSKDLLNLDNFNDNDVEFVSHVLPRTNSVIMHKRKRLKSVSSVLQNRKSGNNNVFNFFCNLNVKEPLAVIDLCSDEDEQQEKVKSPETHFINTKNDAAVTSTPLQTLDSDVKNENKQYHINVQSAHFSQSHAIEFKENSPNIDPLYINIYSPNVIALE